MADTNNIERAEPVAWMDPATSDVIHAERKNAWLENFGIGGKSKAATYTTPLYAAPQPNAALADGWLNPEDMAALERFNECAEDSEAGGHDVPKERMKRLEALGVVHSLGFGRHQITAFGSFVLGSSFARTPLETTDECNARLGREHRAKLGMPAPPTLNASKEPQP